MPNPRLLAIVTAFILVAGAPGAYAAYTLSNLQTIEQLILAKDFAGLRAYITDNPQLLEGDDALAVALRDVIPQNKGGFWARIFVAPNAQGLTLVQNLKATY